MPRKDTDQQAHGSEATTAAPAPRLVESHVAAMTFLGMLVKGWPQG